MKKRLDKLLGKWKGELAYLKTMQVLYETQLCDVVILDQMKQRIANVEEIITDLHTLKTLV